MQNCTIVQKLDAYHLAHPHLPAELRGLTGKGDE